MQSLPIEVRGARCLARQIKNRCLYRPLAIARRRGRLRHTGARRVADAIRLPMKAYEAAVAVRLFAGAAAPRPAGTSAQMG